MPAPIPRDWCAAVVRILRTQDNQVIEWTTPARQRWETDSIGSWAYEAYDGMIEALEDPDIEGNETTSYPGQIATYEFFFRHRKRQMYAKIALKEGRLRLLILSAHLPKRDTL